MHRIVIDTNVLVAGLRSRQGASFALLSMAGIGVYEHVLTVPLVMEYEDVLFRAGMVSLTTSAIQDVIDYLCATGVNQSVHFLWRPCLPDPKDDLVFEAAVNGGCRFLVTHNTRDFASVRSMGVLALRPAAFLKRLKEPTR